MASHAYTTTPLSRPEVVEPIGLLWSGPQRHQGPVTSAIQAMRTEAPITPEMLGSVLAGAFIALICNAPHSPSVTERWLTDLANGLSELGRTAEEVPFLAKTLCAASRVLMQTELA